MSQDWYKKHYEHQSSPKFDDWWNNWCGTESDYSYLGTDKKGYSRRKDEYWKLKGFALAGWIANGN